MKTLPRITLGFAAVALCFGILGAAERARRPQVGTFYSAQRNCPPLPFNPFPDRPVIALGNGRFVYDDLDVDYSQIQRAAEMAAARDVIQGLDTPLADYGTNL